MFIYQVLVQRPLECELGTTALTWNGDSLAPARGGVLLDQVFDVIVIDVV